MVSVINLSKNYGRKVLFEDISFSINRGEKVGLIGPNGSGKSTLFHIILQDIEPSAGSIAVNKNTRIGYLAQECKFTSELSVLQELIKGDEETVALRKEKQELELEGKADCARYGEILHKLDTSGYFTLEHRAKAVLMGLGFKEEDFNRQVKSMSGGWQMRVLLAKLLVYDYDLLLLDEPTNYLDLNAALWLKDYLAGFDGTFIMISHDKVFLNEVTAYTLILEGGSIFKVRGNYDHYEQIKEEKKKFLLKQHKEQEKKRKQLETFIARFHAQPNKASQVRAKRTALEKMQDIELPLDPRLSINDFHFPQARQSGYKVMELKSISKTYPGAVEVYKELDFEIIRGEKAVLAGENGAGKSTLLKILAGAVSIDSGERLAGHNVDIGYFSQTRTDVLNPENTVLQEAYSANPGVSISEDVLRAVLGVFLFTGDDAYKSVKVLSGGEKSRLILAKLLLNPPNLLLLDEPTTHLDVDAVDMLIRALKQYCGTIVFISHDIHFVRSLAGMVYEVKNGRIKKYHGNFNYYLQKRGQPDAFSREARPKKKQAHEAPAERDPRDEHKRRQEEENRKKKLSLRSHINKLKAEQKALKMERYAKQRAIQGKRVYRDEETIRSYKERLEQIDKRDAEIIEEIREVKNTAEKF